VIWFIIMSVLFACAVFVLAAALCRMAARPTPHPTDEDVERSFDDIWRYGGTDD